MARNTCKVILVWLHYDLVVSSHPTALRGLKESWSSAVQYLLWIPASNSVFSLTLSPATTISTTTAAACCSPMTVVHVVGGYNERLVACFALLPTPQKCGHMIGIPVIPDMPYYYLQCIHDRHDAARPSHSPEVPKVGHLHFHES